MTDELVQLGDATSVTLRPIEPNDADRLIRFHRTLSPETTHLRFFAVHPRLSADEVERFTRVDHHDREALVATIDQEIVAVARWHRIPGSSEAEVAFVVTDAWQHEGLGTALFEELVRKATAEGITRFVADALAHNRPMMTVFGHAGMPMTTEVHDGVAHVTLDLTSRTT